MLSFLQLVLRRHGDFYVFLLSPVIALLRLLKKNRVRLWTPIDLNLNLEFVWV